MVPVTDHQIILAFNVKQSQLVFAIIFEAVGQPLVVGIEVADLIYFLIDCVEVLVGLLVVFFRALVGLVVQIEDPDREFYFNMVNL